MHPIRPPCQIFEQDFKPGMRIGFKFPSDIWTWNVGEILFSSGLLQGLQPNMISTITKKKKKKKKKPIYVWPLFNSLVILCRQSATLVLYLAFFQLNRWSTMFDAMLPFHLTSNSSNARDNHEHSSSTPLPPPEKNKIKIKPYLTLFCTERKKDSI
jgi:hypothetical protein